MGCAQSSDASEDRPPSPACPARTGRQTSAQEANGDVSIPNPLRSSPRRQPHQQPEIHAPSATESVRSPTYQGVSAASPHQQQSLMPSSTNTLIATSTNRPLYPSTPHSDAEGARQRRVSAMIDSAMGRIPDSPLIAIVGATSPAAASPSAVGTPQHPPMYRRRRMTNAGSHRHASSTSGIGVGGQRRVSLAASHAVWKPKRDSRLVPPNDEGGFHEPQRHERRPARLPAGPG